MSRRTARVAQQVRAEVARILREDATDPRLRFVTLTRVDVAPDLGNARVFWSTLEGDDAETIAQVGEALEGAGGFLRGRLAAVLPLKRTPELRFRYDSSLALGSRTLEVLRHVTHEPTE